MRKNICALSSAFTLAVLLAAPTPAQAQWRTRIDEGLTKAAPALRAAAAEFVESARSCTVRILVDGEQVALGTVISDDGVVLTKASEIGDTFEVELSNGRRVDGRLLGVAREHDLAAIKVEATEPLPTADLDLDAVEAIDAGAWLVSPDPGDEDGEAVVGNLSVKGLRRIPSSGVLLGVGLGPTQQGVPVYGVEPGSAAERAGLQAGDLIIAVDGQRVGTRRDFVRAVRNAPDGARFRVTISRDGRQATTDVQLLGGEMGVTLIAEAAGVLVTQVSPGSGAEAAGLMTNDIITAIDDSPVGDPATLVRIINDYAPGDSIDVTYLRDGVANTVEAIIGYRSGRSLRGDLQNSMGSTLSNRAVDFPAVLQHDSVLNADEMGGPVVDLHGNVLGINIARAGRVETYALPAQVIQGVLPELLSGKLPAATAPALEAGQEPMPQEPLQE